MISLSMVNALVFSLRQHLCKFRCHYTHILRKFCSAGPQLTRVKDDFFGLNVYTADNAIETPSRSHRHQRSKTQEKIIEKNPAEKTTANVFDEQYFGDLKRPKGGHQRSKNHEEIFDTEDHVNVFDEQYFGNVRRPKQPAKDEGKNKSFNNRQKNDQKGLSTENMNYFDELLLESYTKGKVIGNLDNEKVDVKPHDKDEQMTKSDDAIKRPNQTAYEVVQEIRREKHQAKEDKTIATGDVKKWSGKVDSKGFRVLKDQKMNFDYCLQEEVVQMLKKRIIYEDEEILAIDKPYGLPSHGGPKVTVSVGQLLGPLSSVLRSTQRPIESLHLVHRLDKETTGVMLLAKSQAACVKLQEFFAERKVVKKYWVITRGVPVPQEGVIDIPMADAELAGNVHRMALRPNYPPDMRQMVKLSAASRCRSAADAVTNYIVLASNYSTALVECQPETGVKHQIRCHLAFALNTPILGDHKYSHLSKIAPQRLFPDILQRLGVRQSKVRHVPLHLHARLLVIPEYRAGRNLFIRCSLPAYFKQNMNWLKLKAT